MIPEDACGRRGEPVVVTLGPGVERTGTVEFGDDSTSVMSVYCEDKGRSIGRVVVRPSAVRPDPGGARPCWDKVREALGGA